MNFWQVFRNPPLDIIINPRKLNFEMTFTTMICDLDA
jgi:hypothetical protein